MAEPDLTERNVGPVPADDVAFLEKFLAAAGFLKAPYTLKGALEEWQKSVGIDPTGILDEATRNKLGDVLAFVSGQSPQPTEGTAAGGTAAVADAAPTAPTASGPPAQATSSLGGTPNPDGKFGIPGGAQVWAGPDGYWYAVYTVPGSNPPVPLAWRIENNDDVAAIFGPGNDWKVDRHLTAGEWQQAGVLVFGSSRQLANTSEHPFDAFTANFDTEARIRPWLRDPEVLALTTRAILENRTVTDAELAGTKWWQSHTEGERQWIATYNSDPSTARQRVQDSHDQVRRLMITAGVAEPPDRLVTLIGDRLTAGTWSQQYVQNQIAKLGDPYAPGDVDPTLQIWVNDLAKEGVTLNSLADNTSKVEQLINTWLGPAFAKGISKQQKETWAGRLRNDPQAEEEITNELKRQRVALFGEYPDANLSYDNIAAPWRGIWQQMWGKAPDETDPLFQQVIKLGGSDGLPAVQQLLRGEGIKRGVGNIAQTAITDMESAFGNGVRRAV